MDKLVETLSLSYTLDQLIETHIPIGLFHYRLLLICGLIFMSDAMAIVLIGYLSICVRDDFQLGSSETALISSFVFVGELIGSLLWGIVADRYGRRITLLCSCSLISIFGLLSGFASSFESLCVYRSVVGLGLGGFFVIFDLLAEFIPNSHKGKYLIYVEYFWTLGSLIVAYLSWCVLDRSEGWRILTILSSIPMIISLLLAYIYLPESPKWLLSDGRVNDAKKVMSDVATYNGATISSYHLSSEMEEQATLSTGSSFSELFRRSMWKITLTMWILWGIFGFTYNGIILYVAKLYSNDNNQGTCSFDYYSLIANATSEFFGTYFATLLIDLIGGKKSITSIYFVAGIAVLIIPINSSKIFLLIVTFIVRSCLMGATCCIWSITPDFFPCAVRGFGHSTCNSVARIFAFIVPFIVNSSSISITTCLAAASLLASLASYTLPETKKATNNIVINEYCAVNG